MTDFRIKRGLETNRLSITPADGELIWTTDTHKLYIGDGSTAGGVLSSSSTFDDYVLTTAKGAADGVATLDANSKVPTSQLPSLTLTKVNTVADETAQLALTADEGDIAVRSDESKTYLHNGETTGTMADWTLLSSPTDTIISVNDKTGVVTLDTDDISEGITNLYFTTARLEALINDASVATNETWSANKIQTEITALIDDTIVDTDNVTNKTLSANKIYEIASNSGDSAVAGSIADNAVATDTLWSSSKVKSYNDEKIDDLATSTTTDKEYSVSKIEDKLSLQSRGWTSVTRSTGGTADSTDETTGNITQNETNIITFYSDDFDTYETVDIRGVKGATGDPATSNGTAGSFLTFDNTRDAYNPTTGVRTIGITGGNDIVTGDTRGYGIIDDNLSSSTSSYSSDKTDQQINALINDTAASSTNTYSSTKVESQITALIDDTIVDTDNVTNKTLSANKIYEIASNSGDSAVAGSIADNAVATDTLWSSSKVKSYNDAITFLSRSNTPNSYVANQKLVVNSTADGLIFVPDIMDGGTF